MVLIGIKNTKQYLLVIAFVIFLLIVLSCKREPRVNQKNDYILIEECEISYFNQYDDKGLLMKNRLTKRIKNEYGEMTDLEEEVYYYNAQDSLIRKETYKTYDNQRDLISIDLYSNEIEENILFENYPNDTISYSYRKKNEKRQIVEEYSQTNLDEFEDISISYRKYDTLGRLISDVQKNIFTKNTIAREYKYESQGDTLVTMGIEDGVVSRKTKEYKDKDMVIQVTEYYTLNAIDSLYMKPNQNYSVTYEENFKFLVIEDLDKFGSPIKYKTQQWKKDKD